MDKRRFCLTLNLKNDPILIQEYEMYHQNVPEAILQSFQDAGIISMEIYRWENRLFMIMEVSEDFSLEKKKELDEANPKVLEWEALMSRFQEPIQENNPSEKWVLMKQIFKTS
jgi:L-rhamnose mutarotase